MGERGPLPKRSDQRMGHRAKSEAASITHGPSGVVIVDAPEADEMWHPMARDWFTSLATSGQATYYQPSDWQVARVWAEVLSRQLMADKMSAVMIQAWAASASELLTTEGSRRRGRLELERTVLPVDEDEAAADEAMNVYHAQFGG